MNDIIKLILFNMILFGILKYDKRYSIPIIVFMILYIITIQSSIRYKIVEGNSFFEDFVKLPEFSDYDYSTTQPNSILHNSEDQGYSSVFSFFNGGGKYSTLKNDRISTLEETNKLLDQLIGMFEMGQQNCKGGFEKLTECSRDCGYGTQKKVYRIIQEKGPDGIDCPHTDGHTIKQMCILRDCDIDEKCRHNYECRSGNCDNGTCRRVGECDEDTLYHCYTRKECMGLNEIYENYDGRYEWDSRTNTCSFESKPRVETNIYDRKIEEEEEGESEKYKCDDGECKQCGENENSDDCPYSDENCDGKCTTINVDPCNNIDCGDNGSCVDGSCVCEDGYSGDNCDECAPGYLHGAISGKCIIQCPTNIRTCDDTQKNCVYKGINDSWYIKDEDDKYRVPPGCADNFMGQVGNLTFTKGQECEIDSTLYKPTYGWWYCA